MTECFLYVGSCNRELPYFATANGEGLSCFRIDLESGVSEKVSVFGGVDNPTYVSASPRLGLVAATTEVNGWHEGLVTLFAADPKSGTLEYLEQALTKGDTAAQVSFDHSGKYLACVNYTVLPVDSRPNKSVAVYALRQQGGFERLCSALDHGSSTRDSVRQDRSHAHCVGWTPDNRHVLVTDLGLDLVVAYAFDEATGSMTRMEDISLPPGSGPRHFVHHPSHPVFYVVNELNSTVSTIRYEPNFVHHEVVATCSTLPSGHTGENHCSGIKMTADEAHLFVGNRGHDSIAHFTVDAGTLVPSLIDTVSSGGKTPRDLDIAPGGKVLAVANQDSDVVTLFSIDERSGELTFKSEMPAIGTPTSVSFMA